MDDLDKAIQARMPRYMTNSGHGHVWPRPDGSRARCGGPGMCSVCSVDRIELDKARQTVAESVS